MKDSASLLLQPGLSGPNLRGRYEIAIILLMILLRLLLPVTTFPKTAPRLVPLHPSYLEVAPDRPVPVTRRPRRRMCRHLLHRAG